MKKTKNILVVDTSNSLRNIIRKELSSANYKVYEAANGKEALAILEKTSIDLVTLSVVLPKMSGFDLLSNIRDIDYNPKFAELKNNDIPIIFITAYDTREDREKGFKLGAADFIVKPFKKGTLRHNVDQILKQDEVIRNLKVLIVDDDKISRSIIKSCLSRLHVEVFEADDGRTGYEILKKRNGRIDLVVSDLEMVNMNGDEFCKKIRTEMNLKDLPFIFLTGKNDKQTIINLFQIGATDCLNKPFIKEELIARLNAHIERQKLIKLIKDSSNRDYLTGLFNRRFFFDSCSGLLANAKRHDLDLTTAMLDIDFFKRVNDTYGHDAGDVVLKEVASILESSFRESDIVSRFGGEEFCILATNMSRQEAPKIFNKLRKTIEDMIIDYDGSLIKVTISIGVCLTNEETIEDMVSIADSKLYEAKENGRNRVVVSI